MMIKKQIIVLLLATVFISQTIPSVLAFDDGYPSRYPPPSGFQGDNTTKNFPHDGIRPQIQTTQTDGTNPKPTPSLSLIISYADKMITQRISSLTELLNRVQSDTKLSSDTKSSYLSNIQTMIDNLTTLKTKIDADTDAQTAYSDAKQIVSKYHVYATFEPKTRLLKTLNNLQTTTARLQALVPKLQTLINTLQSQGKDVSQAQPLLADITTQLQTITNTLTTDITNVQNISSTSTNTAELSQVKQDISQTLKGDFEKIRTDVQQIRTLLKMLVGKTESSESGTLTPTTVPTDTSSPTDVPITSIDTPTPGL